MTQPVKWPKIPLNYLESGQVHDMFKLTYNQVRQFIKKSVLYDMRSYVESGLGARITSLLVATFFMIPLVMIVGIGTTISLDNLFGINIPLLSKIFVPIFIIIGSLSELGFLISVFIPRKNIAEFGLRSDIIWSPLIFGMIFLVVPLGVGSLIYSYGYTVFLIQTIVILLYLVFKIGTLGNKRETKKTAYRRFISWFNLGHTMIILIAMDAALIIINLFTNKVPLGLSLISMIYSIFMPFMILFNFYMFGKIYKEIYVVKYARQFRYDWKIPDEEWWFTAETAAKHPQVYPPAKDDAQG